MSIKAGRTNIQNINFLPPGAAPGMHDPDVSTLLQRIIKKTLGELSAMR